MNDAEEIISLSEENFLLNEYKRRGKRPLYINFRGHEFLVPYIYRNNITEFFDDLTVFQDKEYLKYEENDIKPQQLSEAFLENPILFIVPYDLRTKGASDIWKHIEKQMLNQYQKLIKREVQKYKVQSEQTQPNNTNQQQPQQSREATPRPKTQKSTQNNVKKKSTLKAVGEVCKFLGKGLKWTAKQTLLVTAGVAGTPFAMAYKFFDKNARIVRSPQHRQWIENKAIPCIKKGVYKGLIFAALASSPKVVQTVKQLQQEKAKKEKVEAIKQSVLAFYGVKNDSKGDIFYQNFQNIQKHEELIIAAIACSEGFREKAYYCAAGVCTVGFGNTEIAVQDENNIDYNEKDPLVLASIQTVPVTPTTSCTKYGAYFNSAVHLYKYIAPQFKNIDKALSGPQIIAVCMFISNTGGSNFYQSKLCYTINNGNSQNYRETLSLYRSANNVRLEGLVTRRGLEGLIFGADNIPFISQLKPSIFGSPDIQYFQTKTNKRDYLQNEDGTFIPIDYSLVKQASEKFVATNIKGSILGILPPSKIDSAIQKLGIYIDKNGNFCNSSSPKNQTEIVKNNTSKMPLLFSKQKN